MQKIFQVVALGTALTLGTGMAYAQETTSLTHLQREMSTAMVDFSTLKLTHSLADAAYKPFELAKTVAEDLTLYPLKGITGAGKGAQTNIGYLAYHEGPAGPEAILMIRGTQEEGDFITDAQALMVPLDGSFGSQEEALVHFGFQQTALSVQDSLAEVLTDLQANLGDRYSALKIKITGHSLGGALSALMGLWLHKKPSLAPNGVQEVVTFGAPSIGNFSTNALLKELPQVTHYYQFMDPVAQLKASETYEYMPNRVGLPSQDVFSGGNPHGLEGYLQSLEAKFNNKVLLQGLFARVCDRPAVNQYLFSMLNKQGSYLIQQLANPENQKYFIRVAIESIGGWFGLAKQGLSASWQSTFTYLGGWWEKLRPAAVTK